MNKLDNAIQNHFGRQSIYIDVTKLKRQNITGTWVIGLILPICFIIFLLNDDRRMAYVCGILVILLITIWVFFYKNSAFFINNPYLILDEQGLIIQTKTSSNQILWQDVVMIDQILSTKENYYYIETKDKREYRLHRDLLFERIDEIIVLLKRYTEHYGTVKFIY